MRVIVCGSRDWTDVRTIAYAMRGLRSSTVIVHGACQGADSIAEDYARARGMTVESHPYKSALGRRGGPARNAEMAKAGADLCLAFHDNIEESKGTRDMTRRTIQAGIPTIFIRSRGGP